jgi:hypothetical protein
MIARTDGRHFYSSFCSILTTVFQDVSRKIPTFFAEVLHGPIICPDKLTAQGDYLNAFAVQ